MVDKTIFHWLDTAGRTRPDKFSLENKDEIELSVSLIQEELDELKEAISNNDKKECIDAIVDLKWVINNFIYFSGIREEEVQHNEGVVRHSNYSKFCNTEEEAKETVFAYSQGIHPDKQGQQIDCYYKESNDKWIILRKSDDKILKSIKYTPANIVVDEDLFGPASEEKKYDNGLF